MPSAANIVLADSVPVNHTYEPVEIDPANSLFLERTLPDTSAGFEALRLGFARSTPGRPTNRVSMRLDIPYEQVVDGVTVVHSIARYNGTITLPDTMSATDRLNFATLIQNLHANSVVKGYTSTLAPVY